MTLPALTEDYTLSSTGLRLRDPDMSYAAFEELCEGLGEWYATVKDAEGSLKFAIGDAIIQGEALFGQRSYQAFERFGLSEEVLRDCARVSQQVSPSTRRARVPWSQHRAVAAQPPERQKELLRAVADEGMSHAALRDVLRNGNEPRASTVCRCCGKEM